MQAQPSVVSEYESTALYSHFSFSLAVHHLSLWTARDLETNPGRVFPFDLSRNSLGILTIETVSVSIGILLCRKFLNSEQFIPIDQWFAIIPTSLMPAIHVLAGADVAQAFEWQTTCMVTAEGQRFKSPDTIFSGHPL